MLGVHDAQELFDSLCHVHEVRLKFTVKRRYFLFAYALVTLEGTYAQVLKVLEDAEASHADLAGFAQRVRERVAAQMAHG